MCSAWKNKLDLMVLKMCRTITTTKFCEIIVFKPCLFMVREMYHLLFEMTLQKFFKLLGPLQQMMIVIRGFFIRELIGEKSTKSLLSPRFLERVVPCLVISFDLGLDIFVMSCHFQSEILISDQTMSKYLNVSSKKYFLRS